MKTVYKIIPLFIFILFWQIVIMIDPEKQFFFSSPYKVSYEFIAFFTEQRGLYHTFITFFETIAGFTIGNGIGIIIGLLLWFSKRTAGIAEPYLVALGALPVFALAPLMIVWFGVGLWSKIMMAALSTVIIAVVQSYHGAINANEKHLRLMQIFQASRFQVFKIIIFPSSLLWVFNSIKMSIGMALLGAFIGEFIAAEAGVGYIIIRASGLFNMGLVFTGCIILMMMALLLNGAVSQIEKRFVKWKVVD